MSRPELHRGKLAKHPRILSVRPLEREDLARLEQGAGRVQPRVQKLSMAHHRLARLVAAGLRDHEVCAKSGFSGTRLASLKTDPAFQQLVAEYSTKIEQSWLDSLDEFHEASVSNMLRAERQIEEHLDRAEESGELISLNTLLKVTSDRADRFGYGKHSHSTNDIRDVAAIMEQAARRMGQANVIDAPKALSAPAVGDPQPADVTGFHRRV